MPLESIIPLCACGKKDCSTSYGYCHCGCGRQTSIAIWDNPKHGYVKGKPRRFLSGHNSPLNMKPRPETRFGNIEGEDVAFLQLNGGFETIVDTANAHFESLHPFYWKEYAAVKISGTTIKLHSLIFNAADGMEPDHRNRNKLDNRISNLREATRAQQTHNTGPKNGRKYKGTEKIGGGKFRARLCHNKISKKLGCFNLEEDAAAVWDLESLRVRGDFTYLNFPERKEEYLKQIATEAAK